MARSDNFRKPLSQAKATNRKLAANIRPTPTPAAPAPAPEPRDSSSNERNGPAAVGDLLRQRVGEGEKLAPPPFIVVTFPVGDEPVPPSKHGRPRRCYAPDERRGVAETRKRGACRGCRASKTKCLHVSPKIPTEKYQTHPQSHELFALGLTTTSLAANEHEHKQVMKEKIAALDDKLIQKGLPVQDVEANKDGGVKATAVVVPESTSKTGVPRGPPCRQNRPVEVHQTQAHQAVPAQFQQGMGMGRFKLYKKQQPNQGLSKPSKDVTLGMKRIAARKASVSPQPIVCQERPTEIVVSPTAAKQPSNKSFAASHPNAQENINGRCSGNLNSTQPGCEGFQKYFDSHLEAPKMLSLQPKQEWCFPRRSSNNSEQDTPTIATEESMLSRGRSLSPFSEPSSSNPQYYVHLSDLEHSKSNNKIVPTRQIAIWPEHEAHYQTSASAYDDMDLDDSNDNPPSFEDFLNDGLENITMFD